MMRAFGALLLLLLQLPHPSSGKPSAAAVLDDSCRESHMSLVQSRAGSRKMTTASQPTVKPWEKYFYYIGTWHKSGSQLTKDVMRHALDYLQAPRSCHFNVPSGATSYITAADHLTQCWDRLEIPIHWDNSGILENFKATKQMAKSLGFPVRIATSMRKPKDMLISSYCYHHRGEETAYKMPMPFILDMEPLEGMMALWPSMGNVVQQMLDFYTNTSMAGEEVYISHFEEITKSSESFDQVVQGLFKFLFGDMVSEEDLYQMWQAAKAEDQNIPNQTGALSDPGHTSDDECMQETAKALLHLDPAILQFLKDSQEILGYPVDENWPEPVIE